MNHRIAKALTTVGLVGFIYGNSFDSRWSPSFPTMRQCERAHDYMIQHGVPAATVGPCADFSKPQAVDCNAPGSENLHTCGPIFNPGDAQ